MAGTPTGGRAVIVDLFAGPGGVDEGLRSLGRTDVVGLENDPGACATARAAGHERLQVDVYGYDPRKLLARPDAADGVEGLHASAPCGGLSSSGLGLGRNDLGRVVDLIDCLAEGHDGRVDYLLEWEDLRSPLMAEPMRYLVALEPEWFTLEQVPEAVSVWEEYAAHLSGWGWFVDVGVVNARWFGIPQDRERAILVAHRWAPVTVPTRPMIVGLTPAASILGPGRVGFPRLNDKADGGKYRARDMRSTELPAFTVTEKARSWTLVPEVGEPRQLTVPEIGQLQGFRPDYPWQGERSAAALQAANAVPPPMYAGIARGVIRPAVTP